MKSLYDCVRKGESVDHTPFIDGHCHFGPWDNTVIPWSMDYERNIAEMDRYGCDMVWMSASSPGWTEDMSVKNDYVFDFAEKHPQRILPYCTLSANRKDQCLAELKRCLGRGFCIGVKMHMYSQVPYTPNEGFLSEVLEVLDENRLVYMNHDFGNLENWRAAFKKYRHVTFISGHFNRAINDLSLEISNLKDNLCASHGYKYVENEVKRFGRSDTMLVGSDFSLFHLGFGIGAIAYAEIAEKDKCNIVGLNALEIMKKIRWYGQIEKAFEKYSIA